MSLLSGAAEGSDCCRRRALVALKQRTCILEPELDTDWPVVFQIQVLSFGVGQGGLALKWALGARRARVVWERGGGGFRVWVVGRTGLGAQMGSPGGGARWARVVWEDGGGRINGDEVALLVWRLASRGDLGQKVD